MVEGRTARTAVHTSCAIVLLLAAAACERRDQGTDAVVVDTATQTATRERAGTVATPWDRRAPAEERLADSVRRSGAWRGSAETDRAGRTSASAGGSVPASPGDTVAGPRVAADFTERHADISVERVRAQPALPIPDTGAGPSVLHVQILLDRAGFSPGELDGSWGDNTAKAIYWFQHTFGMPTTGEADARTVERLRERSGGDALLTSYSITQDDRAYRFTEVPESVYDQADLACLCYRSLEEMLAERFHVSPEVLRALNPGVDIAEAAVGTTLTVPDVRRDGRPGERDRVARIVISRDGSYLHALRDDGTILFHFPSTLGSGYTPSPGGQFEVTRLAPNPDFHFQPQLLGTVDDEDDDAMLPPGPNSPVGVMWIALSEPHYGIHGTAAPGTIGYASSNGCVRLTNWDAITLAWHIRPGVPVEFR